MKRVLLLFLIILSSCTAVNKANKFYNEGDYATAIAECQKIIESDSLNSEAHFVLGKCYQAQGDLKKAVQSFAAAFQLNNSQKMKSKLIAARLQFADMLVVQQKKSLASEQYQSILKLDSTFTPCLMKLGDLYFENGFLDKANVQYQKVLKLNKENKNAREKIEQINNRTALAEKDYQKGKQHFEKYNYNSAAKYLNKALKNKADHKDAQYYNALAKGSLLYKKGSKSQLWEAIEEFGKAMIIRPGSGEPHYYMGLAYEKKDRREFDNAIQEYKTAVEKEPAGNFVRHCRKKITALTRKRDLLKKFWGK